MVIQSILVFFIALSGILAFILFYNKRTTDQHNKKIKISLKKSLKRRQDLASIDQSRLFGIIDESSDFIGMSDMEGNLLYHNNAAKRMIGLLPKDDMRGMKVENMHPEWAYKIIKEHAIPSALKNGFWKGETVLRNHQTNKEIHVLQTINVHKDEQGTPIYMTTIMQDITELKQTEEALKTSEETFRSAMEYAAIGMAIVSLEGKWLKVNQSLCHIVGYTEEELLKIDFQTITHPEDLELDLHYVDQLLSGRILTYQMEKRYFRKDKSIVWILLSASLLRDSQGKALYFISQIQSIDAQKKAAEELQYMAYHDVLTGLSNRKQLSHSFDMALTFAKRYEKQIAILFMDLDEFKNVNDAFGHDVGDRVLIEIANRLKTTVRATDILVRLGGDEFIVVLTELADMAHVNQVSKKILKIVSMPMAIKARTIQITASIGIGIYPKDSHDVNTLIKCADQALYHAKSEGKDTYCFYKE